MARFYADENFPLPVVEELRRLGHDVLTIQEDGRSNQRFPDQAVLAAATRLDRAILTTNRRHFILLHLTSADHAGIVICTYDPDFKRQAERIDAVLLPNASLAGHLIRVNRPEN
ncbi:MAG: DUF5615 family PIN-like protein [Anaerolinea sp.]|nr:DUF5615 family PIN-like protein [Anaerolinea sp.]